MPFATCPEILALNRPARIGMLAPSSNTVLEPMTTRLLAGRSDVTVHVARFAVTRIALDATALAQFEPEPMLAAARLLADARVDVILWNGTSASWLGLDQDRALVAAIERETGIAAETCVLGLFSRLRQRAARRIGLVTPYTDDVQARIATVFAAEGIDVVAERHLGIADNFSFGLVDEEVVGGMVGAVAEARPDATVILCTNMVGATEARVWSAAYAIPVLDSVAVALDAGLRRIGLDPGGLLPP